MPWKPPRNCPVPDCRGKIFGKSSRCESCSVVEKSEYEKGRPTAYRRGYGRTWGKARLLILRRDPVCKACGRMASKHVDHIVPKERGGTDSVKNLQGLCHSCHSKKTARHDNRWGQRKKGPVRHPRMGSGKE